MENSQIRWDKQHQFHAIEVIALWEGKVTSKHLKAVFNITSSATSAKLFRDYNEVAPSNLESSTSERGKVIGPNFHPCFSEGIVDEYLALLSRHPELNPNVHSSHASSGFVESIHVPKPAVSPTVIRSVVQAIQKKTNLDIWYFSQSKPEGSERIIVPHTLVYSGMRWHVRAWCALKERFTDFVLTRMRINGLDASPVQDKSTAEHDHLWNQYIDIVIGPNPQLPSELQHLICRDYGFSIDQPLTVATRMALIHYQLLAMNIYVDSEKFNPKAHPLVVLNKDKLRQYTFDS